MSTYHNSGLEHRESALSTRACLASMVLLALLSTQTVSAVDLSRQLRVDIAEGTPLEKALFDLVVVEAHIPMDLATADAVGHKIHRIKGRNYTLAAALSSLLKGTGLSYEPVGDAIYIIRAPATALPPKQPIKHPPDIDPINRPQESRSGDAGMAEVTVKGTGTGTHLFENFPLPGIRILTQADFDRGDFQTVGDAIRSLPQNFGGGLNPTVVSARGTNNAGSQSGASSADLHGLGNSSTLILINGHKLSAAEDSGSVDVSLIPISVVDRIEIMTGGASAVYGSDAVSGIVNIIMRDEYQGLQLSSTLGDSTDGGGFLRHYSFIGGRAWHGGNAYTAFDCAWQHAIDSSQRSYVPLAVAGTTLLPESRYCSRVLSLTQKLSPKVEVSLVGLLTNRATAGTENLTALSPGVTTSTQSTVNQYAVMGSVRASLGADWTATLALGVSQDDVDSPKRLLTYGSPYDEGDKLDNHLRSVEVTAGGTLLHMFTGPMRLAAGAGYTEEDFHFANIPTSILSIDQQRRVRFLFGEARIPLLPVGMIGDKTTGFSALSLRLAGRASSYSDVGTALNPKIELLYRPSRSFSMEASWGTSYRAPTLLQQYNVSQANLEYLPDVAAPGGQSLTLLAFGGNTQLRPEESSALTFDLAYTPAALPDAAFDLTWYRIDDRKRIEFPTLDTGNPLSDENVLPFVLRNPSPQDIGLFLARSQLHDLTGGKYTPEQATLIIDDRNQNISRIRASGIDLQAVYGKETHWGQFEGAIKLTYLDLHQQVAPMSSYIRLSGTTFNPPNFRSRIGLNWNDAGYRGSVFLNHTGSFTNTATAPPEPVTTWTTLDASIGYLIPRYGHGPNTKLSLSVLNMLNRRPPSVSTAQPGPPNIGLDTTNALATGRFVTLQVALER